MIASNQLTWMVAVVLVGLACDLEPKSLGNETETASGGDATAGDSGTAGGECEDGDTMMQDCNSCGCIGGAWACTAIGCGGDDTATPGECIEGESKQEDCNDCSCLDGLWACTAIACAPDGELDVCGPEAPHDDLQVEAVTLAGDILDVDVSYGGGCEMHLLDGCWDGLFAESSPVQVSLFVSHENNGDLCEAVESSRVAIDLSPMRVAYQEGYQTSTGTIAIHLEGWADEILYAF
jgi:Pacifastin inhibitor (LCMII)